MRLFDPWIGENYNESGLGGVRVALLGEAHYGTPDRQTSDFTYWCINNLAKVERGHAFFTKVAKLFIDVEPGVPLSLEQKCAFWDSVAFTNYVQSFPSGKARVRPSAEMWSHAAECLPATLAELDADFVLVLGKSLANRLPPLPLVDPATLCYVPHPSSFGFRPQRWRSSVLSAFHQAGPNNSFRPNPLHGPA